MISQQKRKQNRRPFPSAHPAGGNDGHAGIGIFPAATLARIVAARSRNWTVESGTENQRRGVAQEYPGRTCTDRVVQWLATVGRIISMSTPRKTARSRAVHASGIPPARRAGEGDAVRRRTTVHTCHVCTSRTSGFRAFGAGVRSVHVCSSVPYYVTP